ncbi:MAG: sigma-54 dependent transcriptional regulator [Myxococcota bacterium]
MPSQILVVDDEPKIGELLRTVLERADLSVEVLQDPEQALALLKERPFDVVITDFKMPGINGLELLRRTKAIRPDCEVVVMTAHATVEMAREALKRGAVDFITKPFSPERELKPLILSILDAPIADPAETPTPAAGSKQDQSLTPIVGRGAVMRELLGKVEKIARSEASVFLRGESGTGKELIADAIHELSARRDRKLIKVNCAALPETLLESELFGHTKGSFSGATSDHKGLFQVADNGTLFLDEIGEVSPTFQPKLLRVLQEGELHRIGEAGRVIKVDVRVIAASNRDLEEAVAAGTFRQDLYYRLSVVPLRLPALRERREDLSDLIAHFVRVFADNQTVRFSPDALEAFEAYDWPGNIRELSNAVQHAIVLGDLPEIGLDDLPVALQDFQSSRLESSLIERNTLESIEVRSIINAMKKTGNNVTQAAQLLGVTRRTLTYRIKKYDLQDSFRGGAHSPADGTPSVPHPAG